MSAGLKGWLKHDDDSEPARRGSEHATVVVEDLGDVEPEVIVCVNTGEVTVEDPESSQALLWQNFKLWCTSTFHDSEDMMQKLLFSKRLVTADDRVACDEFCDNLEEYFWSGGNERLLFKMHCPDEQGMALKNLKWLDLEKRRQLRKERARQKSKAEAEFRTKNQLATKMVLVKFKRTLKQTYGSYIRAWRKALSPNDSMQLRRMQFFLACSEMGWASDVRRLWKAFGKGSASKEDAAFISIDELDPKSAETLAHFRLWITENFGTASVAFAELDRHNKKSVTREEFVNVLAELGFLRPAKTLFHDLNKSGTKTLVVDDILFLDRWTPPAFLLAVPNQSALDIFKALILSKFRSYLKAWRRILDTDNSNKCDWQEFQVACSKHLLFTKDVPGAWRALDKDLRGFITLAQIDPMSAESLQSFREWATREFGSVKSAFRVFDVNSNGTVSTNEFKGACRIYNYTGNAGAIFRALDVERSYAISIEEVAFLDEWDVEAMWLDASATLSIHTRKCTGEPQQDDPEDEAAPKDDTPAEGSQDYTPSEAARPSNPRRRAYTNVPMPERVWWHTKPLMGPPTTPRKVRSSKGNSIWCATCKTRGCCSHVRGHFQRIVMADADDIPRVSSATPALSEQRARLLSPAQSARPRASTSMSLRASTSMSVRASSSMSTKMPSWAWEAQRQLHSARDASPQASQDNYIPRTVSSFGCGGPDAEVQYMALQHFPLGSVSPMCATAALKMLTSNIEVLSSACGSPQATAWN